VGARRRSKCILDLCRLVAPNAEIGDLATKPAQHRGEHDPIGVVQLRLAFHRAGLDDLVARGQHCDSHTSAHLDFG